MVPTSLLRSLDSFEQAVASVEPGRWDAPSPCEGWSARAVAGHVIGNLRSIRALATGQSSGETSADPSSVACPDPLATWRHARAELTTALEGRSLDQPVALPWGGELPLGEFLARYPLEIVVHTWDLATATGQVVVIDPGLVHDALGTARQFAAAGRSAGLIGPERTVPENADDWIQLLAIFGRIVPA